MCVPTQSSVKPRKPTRWAVFTSVFLVLGSVLFVSGCASLSQWLGGPAAADTNPEILLDRLATDMAEKDATIAALRDRVGEDPQPNPYTQ